jgi:hypothetical protein
VSRWLPALVTLVLVQPIIFGMMLTVRPRPATPPPSEIALGEFRFVAAPEDPGNLRACQFQVRVSLSPQWRAVAQAKLSQEPGRFRQAVEELLREARGADFADPSLRLFRRHLREKLNETLGVAAINEVFITDWRPEWGQRSQAEQPSALPAEDLHSDAGRFPPSPDPDW